MATIKDEQTAKDFLRADKTDEPKKEIAKRFGLRPDEVSQERKRWSALLLPKKNATNGNGNGHKPKPAKPKKKIKAKAPAVSLVVARQQMIAALKTERKRIEDTIALLEKV